MCHPERQRARSFAGAQDDTGNGVHFWVAGFWQGEHYHRCQPNYDMPLPSPRATMKAHPTTPDHPRPYGC